MSRCGDASGWSHRTAHFASPGEGSGHFDAHFQVDLTVPVNRNVPACALYPLSAMDIPHGATGRRNNFGEFWLARASAHHGEGLTGLLFESDFVCHWDLSLAG